MSQARGHKLLAGDQPVSVAVHLDEGLLHDQVLDGLVHLAVGQHAAEVGHDGLEFCHADPAVTVHVQQLEYLPEVLLWAASRHDVNYQHQLLEVYDAILK